MGETSWIFLIVGSFAAVGAAMAVGTVAALLRYQRTGVFPGGEEPAELPRRRLIALWARVVVGVIVAVVGIAAVQRAGLF